MIVAITWSTWHKSQDFDLRRLFGTLEKASLPEVSNVFKHGVPHKFQPMAVKQCYLHGSINTEGRIEIRCDWSAIYSQYSNQDTALEALNKPVCLRSSFITDPDHWESFIIFAYSSRLIHPPNMFILEPGLRVCAVRPCLGCASGHIPNNPRWGCIIWLLSRTLYSGPLTCTIVDHPLLHLSI